MMMTRSRVVVVKIKDSEWTEVKLTGWAETEGHVILVANRIWG